MNVFYFHLEKIVSKERLVRMRFYYVFCINYAEKPQSRRNPSVIRFHLHNLLELRLNVLFTFCLWDILVISSGTVLS